MIYYIENFELYSSQYDLDTGLYHFPPVYGINISLPILLDKIMWNNCFFFQIVIYVASRLPIDVGSAQISSNYIANGHHAVGLMRLIPLK